MRVDQADISDRSAENAGQEKSGHNDVGHNDVGHNDVGLPKTRDYETPLGPTCRCGEELKLDDLDYILGGQVVKIVSFIKK